MLAACLRNSHGARIFRLNWPGEGAECLRNVIYCCLSVVQVFHEPLDAVAFCLQVRGGGRQRFAALVHRVLTGLKQRVSRSEHHQCLGTSDALSVSRAHPDPTNGSLLPKHLSVA